MLADRLIILLECLPEDSPLGASRLVAMSMTCWQRALSRNLGIR